MAYINMRSSVLGVKEEATEGVLIDPAANTDYLKLQDDAAIAEGRETLENAELTGSIGGSKDATGISNPTFSTSAYLKHSAVEGEAPDMGVLLKSLFGSEAIRATERDTVAGSTATVLNVDAGEGAEFQRGDAVLVKDGANGYSIRPIESVSVDALTLGFDLTAAPAAGVNLGKSVTYIPTNDSHPTVSLHMYHGNGGLHQAIAGGRVVGYDMTAEAGQYINGSFSVEGIGFYNNPINITATDTYIDFTDDGGTHAAVITAKQYSDPEELATALQTAMNAVATDNITVTYVNRGADAGKFTIAGDGAVFSLLWSTGANTANTVGDKIGFSVAADDTGALSYTGDSVLSWAAPHTPDYDSGSPIVAKNQEVFFGTSSADITCINPSSVSVSIANTKATIGDICALTGQSASLIVGREVTVSFTAVIPQHCVAMFARYRRNDTVRFMYNVGSKADSTNWDVGKSACIYIPTAVITSLEIADEDGIARINAEVKAFVDDGKGEVFISFV